VSQQQQAAPAKAGAVAKVDASGPVSVQALRQLADQVLPQIVAALPAALKPAADRFARCLITEFQRNESLAQCTGLSLLGCAVQAAQLGLEIGGPLGQAYLVPYRNTKRGVHEAQFQIGYRGFIALAHRTGKVQTFHAHPVRENDEFDLVLGTEPRIHHKPAKTDRGPIVGVYALLRTTNGGRDFEYMSLSEITEHRGRYSKQRGNGASPWDSAFEEMARKTPIRRIAKRVPLSVELTQAAVLSEYDDEGVPQNLAGLVNLPGGAAGAIESRAGRLRQRMAGVRVQAEAQVEPEREPEPEPSAVPPAETGDPDQDPYAGNSQNTDALRR
jgi:recombination protein RecT